MVLKYLNLPRTSLQVQNAIVMPFVMKERWLVVHVHQPNGIGAPAGNSILWLKIGFLAEESMDSSRVRDLAAICLTGA
ncbi:hypothetical protein Tsubulata_033577 [Turnera subulata]|uniref:Uncharacterized protein n=1 Tax=Turnera subulata TaxID=218843 RepID=A0A9Q0G2N5_9ROSI|nr:hypothetical protein Tsubulata_033577 [Turnera subulata]